MYGELGVFHISIQIKMSFIELLGYAGEFCTECKLSNTFYYPLYKMDEPLRVVETNVNALGFSQM